MMRRRGQYFAFTGEDDSGGGRPRSPEYRGLLTAEENRI